MGWTEPRECPVVSFLSLSTKAGNTVNHPKLMELGPTWPLVWPRWRDPTQTWSPQLNWILPISRWEPIFSVLSLEGKKSEFGNVIGFPKRSLTWNRIWLFEVYQPSWRGESLRWTWWLETWAAESTRYCTIRIPLWKNAITSPMIFVKTRGAAESPKGRTWNWKWL